MHNLYTCSSTKMRTKQVPLGKLTFKYLNRAKWGGSSKMYTYACTYMSMESILNQYYPVFVFIPFKCFIWYSNDGTVISNLT